MTDPPSTIILELAVLWASGKPMLMAQLGALTRWVADREELDAEHLAQALRVTPHQARQLLERAGRP